ncbi:MAG: hypothetical protein HW407_2356 [Bacteroidetes bacterium]|nr:hypothetical protein [Bacteroidota bacterium]
MKTVLASLVVLLLIDTSPMAVAQDNESMVAIYNVSAGKHLEFLKWMAEAEAVAKEAGAPATQWYAHHQGAGWDFISITPQLPSAQQEAVDKKDDEIRKKKGMPIGMAASLKFRQYIGNHSDTFAGGPYSAADLVKMAEGK